MSDEWPEEQVAAAYAKNQKAKGPLSIWESMFGNASTAKAGVYTVTYSKFTSIIDDYIAEQVQQARLDENEAWLEAFRRANDNNDTEGIKLAALITKFKARIDQLTKGGEV